MSFHEDLLFTHRGLSGPGVLQISSYWKPGTPLQINLLPGVDLAEVLAQAKLHSRKLVANELAAHLPAPGRCLGRPHARAAAPHQRGQRQGPGQTGRTAVALGDHAHGHRRLQKSRGHAGRRGHQGAVPANHGVQEPPGLYFIGEVVDITGWLGGYNFQWAWASAAACAQAMAEKQSVMA
jgi:predicted flavoprotein YhiN